MKTPLHAMGERNGTKTELYRTNAKVSFSNFALIIIIVVHVIKHQSVIINKYMQKAGKPENDAGFLKVIIIAAVYI